MEIQLWRSILCPYELAVKELIVKFEHIISGTSEKMICILPSNRSADV